MPCRSRHMGNYRNMARGENGYYPQIVRVGSPPLAAIQPLQEQTPLRRIRSHPREYSELYSVTPGEFFFASDHIDEEFRSLIQLAARSVFAIMAENDSHTFSASSEQLHHNQRNLQQFATVSFFYILFKKWDKLQNLHSQMARPPRLPGFAAAPPLHPPPPPPSFQPPTSHDYPQAPVGQPAPPPPDPGMLPATVDQARLIHNILTPFVSLLPFSHVVTNFSWVIAPSRVLFKVPICHLLWVRLRRSSWPRSTLPSPRIIPNQMLVNLLQVMELHEKLQTTPPGLEIKRRRRKRLVRVRRRCHIHFRSVKLKCLLKPSEPLGSLM